MYLYLNHSAAHLKITQHCRATILQLKTKTKKQILALAHIHPWRLEEITAVWSSSLPCHPMERIQPLSRALMKTKAGKVHDVQNSAQSWHREEPSNGCQEWQGWIVVFTQGENQERPSLGYHIRSNFWQRCWRVDPHHCRRHREPVSSLGIWGLGEAVRYGQ